MKVYVLTIWFGYGVEGFVGVFSSQGRAEEAGEAEMRANLGADYYDVMECVLDTPLGEE